nr:uncharacterized mitochondrial protein AtMg00860-like [Nicotiana tomentosiformis]
MGVGSSSARVLEKRARIRAFTLRKKKEPSSQAIEAPQQLELKPLPSHLKYAFLGHNSTLRVIILSGIVLGYLVSSKGIEVDRAKIDVIEKLPPPPSVKAIRSFLGHAGFYRWFIKDFSKIANPLCKLIETNHPFVFSDDYRVAFEGLKKRLVSAPIIVSPNWE